MKKSGLMNLGYLTTFMCKFGSIKGARDKDVKGANREVHEQALELELAPHTKGGAGFDAVEHYREQLPGELERSYFELGTQLTRLHGMMSGLQVQFGTPYEMLFRKGSSDLITSVGAWLDKLGHSGGKKFLPDFSLGMKKDDPWMQWSGDACRESLIKLIDAETGVTPPM